MVELSITRFSYPGHYPEICEPEAPWTFEVELEVDPWSRCSRLVSAQIVEPGCPSDEPHFIDCWDGTPREEDRILAMKQCLWALQEGAEIGVANLLPEAREDRLDQLADLADFLRDTDPEDVCLSSSEDEVPSLRMEVMG